MPTSRLVLLMGLVLCATFARLIPHAENFAPLTAITLFSAAYLPQKRWAMLLPVAARFVSDLILQSTKYDDPRYQSYMWIVSLWIYAAMLAIAAIGLVLRGRVRTLPVSTATLAGAATFFLITNFGAWVASPTMYARSASGLWECYVAGAPFFRNTLIGDVVFSAVLFGGFALLERFVPQLRLEPAKAPA